MKRVVYAPGSNYCDVENVPIENVPPQPEAGKDAGRRWVLHVFQGQRFTPYDGEFCSGRDDCPESQNHVAVVPEAELLAERERAAKAEEAKGMLRLLDNLDCPEHGRWMEQGSGYAKCGKCHDDVRAERDAALATVERVRALPHDKHLLGGCCVSCARLQAALAAKEEKK